MDPPPPSTTSSSSSSTPTPTKLRLMCSYGGHIIPRPQTKSLYYANGDTRIITIPTTTPLSLSSLLSHLSTSLHVSSPFSLKYQLPEHDLDSLVSISSDDDLLVMLDEHKRLSSTRSRIRLFLFPNQPISVQPELPTQLNHPKTESWFVDVLKSAKIMQKEGYGGEGNVGVCGGEAESMVLETTSSFGSTSSSTSLSNLPAKSAAQLESDCSMATVVSNPQTGADSQDIVIDNKISVGPVEVDRKIVDSSAEVEMNRMVEVSGFPLQFEQPVQFVHTGAAAPVHYVNPMYYVMNSPVPMQQQVYYQAGQPHPIYFIPVAQHYNLPVQSGLVNAPSVASNHPPVYPNTLLNPVHVAPVQLAYKVAPASAVPELASQIYRTIPVGNSIVDVPCYENRQYDGGLAQGNHQAKPAVGVPSREPAVLGIELDDDPARSLIYKSQPPPPTLPSQYQTMTNATTVLLSGALAQLNTDNSKQQLRPS